MSRKPEKNLNDEAAEEGESDDDSELENEVAADSTGELDEVSDDEVEEVEEVDEEDDDDEFDDDEEEFSLDQLSQAYAEVLKTRSGSETDKANEDSDEETDEDDSGDESDEDPGQSDDNVGCQISPASIIESILFVGTPKDVKLNSRKVAAILRDVSPKEVTKAVRELNKKYEKENAAYRVESDGGVFKMILDPNLLDFQQDFFGRNRQVRLSQSAIDVMAIVAYNQPATREQVDKIRAKPSGGVLNQLVRRQLLFIEPGTENPKIKYYSTTDKFLDLFHLEELADLPQSHDVSDIDELAD